MTSIASNIAELEKRIEKACKQNNRERNSITLMAVSKTRELAEINQAAAAGIHHFGENYLQEALEKIENCSQNDLIWHLIGPLQSNKTRAAASHFDWIHTIDRLKIAQRLNDQRPADQTPLNICIQINIDNEASKSGIAPETLFDFADQIAQMNRLQLRGIMVIPKATENEKEALASFSATAKLFHQLQQTHPQVDTLSMGMSNDFETAIAAGSTMIRVGTALFGPRPSRN